MKLSSSKKSVSLSAQQLFESLSKAEDFEKLMPKNLNKFEVVDDNNFVFSIQGMPEIALKIEERIPYSKIVLKAGGGKIPFQLTGIIQEESENACKVHLEFEGSFNPMMAMMVKKPITAFIETLASNVGNN